MTGTRLALFGLLMVLALTGCGLTEFKQRREALEKLCATNAPLRVVESTLGVRFSIERVATPGASAPVSNATTWQERIAQKRSKASAVGHTSTISMQTWIFLDEKDRLIDFEVGAQ